MKNLPFHLAFVIFFISASLNAQSTRDIKIGFRLAPSVGSLQFEKTFYNEKSIKGAFLIGDDRNLMSIITDIGKAANPQLGHNNKTVTYINVGLQRCMIKTKQERRLISSLHVGLSAFFSEYRNYKSNCTLTYSDGWGAAGLTKVCDPTSTTQEHVLLGLPINYYLDFKTVGALRLSMGCHATLLSNFGHSIAISLGVGIGN